ncbi:MAG: beta-ketoacyl-[acyl-carrier-protein] synthase family protein [Acidimicrobiales bacterium]|nr:beta-ketoacyl-[acyl-carrier-protein] synthase family protein [Acidimicrobiales bacterium]
MTARRRAVITGIGTVSAAGIGKEAFWQSLLRDHDLPVAAALSDFDPTPWVSGKDIKRSDPYVLFAIAAASLALRDAGEPTLEPDRTGVIMGNLYGAGSSIERQMQVLAAEGRDAVSPLLCAIACEDACASQISIRFGFTGPSRLVVASCASGTVAVADAAALIMAGTCDAVLAGATLGPVPDVIVASYENLRVRSPSRWVRPFDERRDGFEFAEGAAVLLLEEASQATARRARVYAEIAGWATSNDAFHISKPSGLGIELAMRWALDHAGVSPAEVLQVNAHGTGTITGDREEAAAIGRVFGPNRPAVTSIKGRTGHSLAAAGAFEAAALALSIERGLIPPTATELRLDPGIDVDVVHGEPRPWLPGLSISNSFGLGGHNATIVMRPFAAERR